MGSPADLLRVLLRGLAGSGGAKIAPLGDTQLKAAEVLKAQRSAEAFPEEQEWQRLQREQQRITWQHQQELHQRQARGAQRDEAIENFRLLNGQDAPMVREELAGPTEDGSPLLGAEKPGKLPQINVPGLEQPLQPRTRQDIAAEEAAKREAESQAAIRKAVAQAEAVGATRARYTKPPAPPKVKDPLIGAKVLFNPATGEQRQAGRAEVNDLLTQGWSAVPPDKISDKAREEQDTLSKADFALQTVMQTYDPSFLRGPLGTPIKNRMTSIAEQHEGIADWVDQTLGTSIVPSKRESSFRSAVQGIMNETLHALSGAAVTEHEMARLVKQLPSLDVGPKAFEARWALIRATNQLAREENMLRQMAERQRLPVSPEQIAQIQQKARQLAMQWDATAQLDSQGGGQGQQRPAAPAAAPGAPAAAGAQPQRPAGLPPNARWVVDPTTGRGKWTVK